MKNFGPLLLQARVQNYAWGRKPSESRISLLTPLAVEQDRSLALAELWVGAHPRASSVVLRDLSSSESITKPVELRTLLIENPEILGASVKNDFLGELPFLFKVLSISQPLSIQLHPDSSTAKKLHKQEPANYPDANPKPEVGIALEQTSLLYGFRAKEEILGVLTELSISEIDLSGSVEEIFRGIYRLDAELIRSSCQKLYGLAASGKLGSKDSIWINKLATMYPQGDVGVLSFSLLNLVELLPGEAVFIGPNIPHAYLSGELIECMANSDNVIRAGLTQKFCDVERLLELADYKVGRPKTVSRSSDGIWEYLDIPVREFRLGCCRGEISFELEKINAVQLIFCLSGELQLEIGSNQETVFPGAAIIIPADSAGLSIKSKSAEVYRVSIPD